MPEKDGHEATGFIRRTLPMERQPWTIALTANAMTGHEQKRLEVGLDAYVAKPKVFAKLITMLQKAIDVCTQRAPNDSIEIHVMNE